MFAGAEDHLIRLTIIQVWARTNDPRASAALAEAHAILQAEASQIAETTLRHSFLTRIPEHRRIAALWSASQATVPGARADDLMRTPADR